MLGLPWKNNLWVGMSYSDYYTSNKALYQRFKLMFEVSRTNDPIMHFETEMKFGDYVHFMLKSQL